MKPIPYGKQDITEEDLEAVRESLLSDYLTQGPKIVEFENAFASYVGAKYAVAVANGTAALHLAALALDVKKGDKVISTPITFVASSNCIRYCGGDVVFADIEPETYLIDIIHVRRLLESSPKGTYQGIVVVDFAGRAVNLEAFRSLADEYGCWILEDACHAPGGFFKDSQDEVHKCGDSSLADLAIFSFHPVKHIVAGEGGAITTNDKSLYEKLLKLRTHGITKNPDQFVNTIDFAVGEVTDAKEYPGWYMEMQTLGFNYRLTEFQSALALSQLSRADEGLKRRMEIAQSYSEALEGKDFIRSQSGFIEGHAYHLYVIEVDDRLGLYNFLRSKNILPQIHYVPSHLMPYYRESGWKEGDLPRAEKYYQGCNSLPMYPTLTKSEQDYVIESILAFYK